MNLSIAGRYEIPNHGWLAKVYDSETSSGVLFGDLRCEMRCSGEIGVIAGLGLLRAWGSGEIGDLARLG